MVEETVKVVNPLGLHARAAGQLVKLAGRFRSRIRIVRSDASAEADAKSMLSVLTLAAAFNTILILRIEGDDEAEALELISKLFRDGFGEN